MLIDRMTQSALSGQAMAPGRVSEYDEDTIEENQVIVEVASEPGRSMLFCGAVARGRNNSAIFFKNRWYIK